MTWHYDATMCYVRLTGHFEMTSCDAVSCDDSVVTSRDPLPRRGNSSFANKFSEKTSKKMLAIAVLTDGRTRSYYGLGITHMKCNWSLYYQYLYLKWREPLAAISAITFQFFFPSIITNPRKKVRRSATFRKNAI